MRSACVKRAKQRILNAAESGKRVDTSRFATAAAEELQAMLPDRHLPEVDKYIKGQISGELSRKIHPSYGWRLYMSLGQNVYQRVDVAPSRACWKHCGHLLKKNRNGILLLDSFFKWCERHHGKPPEDIADLRQSLIEDVEDMDNEDGAPGQDDARPYA